MATGLLLVFVFCLASASESLEGTEGAGEVAVASSDLPDSPVQPIPHQNATSGQLRRETAKATAIVQRHGLSLLNTGLVRREMQREHEQPADQGCPEAQETCEASPVCQWKMPDKSGDGLGTCERKPCPGLAQGLCSGVDWCTYDLFTKQCKQSGSSLLATDSAAEHASVQATAHAVGQGQAPVATGASRRWKKIDLFATTTTTTLRFEYQSSIGRDGYEPDPFEPASEFFGPFQIDYLNHILYLKNWNLGVEGTLPRAGEGNLLVGNGHNFSGARNSAIFGNNNTLEGDDSVVFGLENSARGEGSVISGGFENVIRSNHSAISGGKWGETMGTFATVAGGVNNYAGGKYSTVTAGMSNEAWGNYSTVTGGMNNMADANVSSINGGNDTLVAPEKVVDTIQGGNHVGRHQPPKPIPLLIPAGEELEEPPDCPPGKNFKNCAKQFHEAKVADEKRPSRKHADQPSAGHACPTCGVLRRRRSGDAVID